MRHAGNRALSRAKTSAPSLTRPAALSSRPTCSSRSNAASVSASLSAGSIVTANRASAEGRSGKREIMLSGNSDTGTTTVKGLMLLSDLVVTAEFPPEEPDGERVSVPSARRLPPHYYVGTLSRATMAGLQGAAPTAPPPLFVGLVPRGQNRTWPCVAGVPQSTGGKTKYSILLPVARTAAVAVWNPNFDFAAKPRASRSPAPREDHPRIGRAHSAFPGGSLFGGFGSLVGGINSLFGRLGNWIPKWLIECALSVTIRSILRAKPRFTRYFPVHQGSVRRLAVATGAGLGDQTVEPPEQRRLDLWALELL